MSLSVSPIGPWWVVAIAALAVTALTLWAYVPRLRAGEGRWRWVALSLRLMAVLLCVLAALRPSLVLMETKKQAASMVFLIDATSSMKIADEVRGQSRWGVALKTLGQAREAAKRLGGDLDVKFYRFDTALHDQKPDDALEPDGRETGLGSAMLEALKRQAGTRVATMVVLSDGASNAGLPPLTAAQRLKSQQVPVVTVGFGSASAGESSRDVAAREIVAGPTVFVKNELQVRGTLNVRGYPNQTLDVELWVEGQKTPVQTKTVRVPEGAEVVPITGLKFTPEEPGETKVMLRVKPKEGELIKSNNEVSTFVTVLKGGLAVLYVQGPNFSWEYKYLTRALDAAREIQAELRVIRRPAEEGQGELKDADFAPNKYDVFILGDVPAAHLTRRQHQQLVRAVERGAGLLMLGGRSSFGAGGWANTELAAILPVEIHLGDGQFEPENGLKVIPNPRALDNYILRVAPSATENARIWSDLPPITGINRFGPPKEAAVVLAEGPNHEPIMVDQELGKGRVLVFGGETWLWARGTDENRGAHRKFWRQAILWLAHKEDQGESHIKLSIDRRRVALGQKLDLTVTARDAKNEPISGVAYETTVTRIAADGTPERVDLFPQGDEARGSYFAKGAAGEYRVTVSGTHNGQDLGRDTARFLVYQDDRELENPAADRALLRQIAEITDGKDLPPEQLARHIASLDHETFTEYVSQTEHRIWDNWPFFLVFTLILSLEWWLRKRKGWV